MFSHLGPYNFSRPSYVMSSAFHHGYSCAIGIFSSDGIPIERNVIYRTVTYGLDIEGTNNIIRKNLITMNYWYGTLKPWQASLDRKFFGMINIVETESVILEDNLAAGGERIGIHYRGDLCSGKTLGPGFNHSIKRNTVYGTFAGVVIMPRYAYSFDCLRIADMTVAKSVHWGIYYQSTASIIVESNTLIDNQVGVFTLVFNPKSTLHEAGSKFISVRNNLFVGQSPSFNCSNDIRPEQDLNAISAGACYAYGGGLLYNSKIALT